MLATRMRLAAAGSGAALSYATVLQTTYSANEVWPLVDIASGTNIGAFVNSARDGTLTGWALQNTAGPVTGTNAPSSDGVNDYGDIYTSGGGVGLADIFNGSELSIFIWCKVSGAGVWTDGANRDPFSLRADGSNFLIMRKPSSSNRFQMRYRAGGTTQTVTEFMTPTDWFSAGVSVSKTADAVKGYINGSQVSTTQTGLGTFSGSLSSTEAVIGASDAVPALVWDGWLAYAAVKFGGVWSDADFAGMHAAAATSEAD